MAAETDKRPGGFIQERLDSLNSIDGNIVALLDNISALFETYSTPKTSANEYQEVKDKFSEQTCSVYSALSKVAIDLRKEVKIMDDNIGVYDKNDEKIMILPISVDQKNTALGALKLKDELRELDKSASRNSLQHNDVEMADSVEVKKETANVSGQSESNAGGSTLKTEEGDAMEEDFAV